MYISIIDEYWRHIWGIQVQEEIEFNYCKTRFNNNRNTATGIVPTTTIVLSLEIISTYSILVWILNLEKNKNIVHSFKTPSEGPLPRWIWTRTMKNRVVFFRDTKKILVFKEVPLPYWGVRKHKGFIRSKIIVC